MLVVHQGKQGDQHGGSEKFFISFHALLYLSYTYLYYP